MARYRPPPSPEERWDKLRHYWRACPNFRSALAAISLRDPVNIRRMRLFIAGLAQLSYMEMPEAVKPHIELIRRKADDPSVPTGEVFGSLITKVGSLRNAGLAEYNTLIVARGLTTPPSPHAAFTAFVSIQPRHKISSFGTLAWKLFHHIAGDPFLSLDRPYVSSTVRALAERVDSQPVGYPAIDGTIGPLHDALLDEGMTRFADHFDKPEEWHPRGCWAIEALLGRPDCVFQLTNLERFMIIH